MTEERSYDVVLFGATGFTGGLIAEVLTRRALTRENPLRCALAGRDRAKLEAVRARLAATHRAAEQLGLIVADSSDPASLRAMAGATKVVISTVGPYTRYGEPLVAACIDAGCDYVDLTGEPHWWREMVERYHARAAARDVLIIPACGYDSIPADVGALHCATQLPSDQPMTIDAYASGFGSFSGGTLASALEILGAARVERRGGAGPRERSGTAPPLLHHTRELDRWGVRTFVLDPWVVRRSAELRPDEFGTQLRYRQYFGFASRAAALAAIGFGAAAATAARLGPVRSLMKRARPSGSGPSERQRARGWFRIDFIGRGGGREVHTHVSGGDPGYGETSKMISEAAIMLVEARERLPIQGGVVTPAAGLGREFIPRLEAVGLEFAVDR